MAKEHRRRVGELEASVVNGFFEMLTWEETEEAAVHADDDDPTNPNMVTNGFPFLSFRLKWRNTCRVEIGLVVRTPLTDY